MRPAFESQLALLRELALTVFKQQLAMGGGSGSPRSPGRGAATFVERAQRCVVSWGAGRGVGWAGALKQTLVLGCKLWTMPPWGHATAKQCFIFLPPLLEQLHHQASGHHQPR